MSIWNGRLIVSGGFRFDEFRYKVQDRVNPRRQRFTVRRKMAGERERALTPAKSVPLTFTLNYGRGINSIDARGVVSGPTNPVWQLPISISSERRRISDGSGISADVFLIDHSNEQVYIPDDGSFEFKGPSRAYGFEAKASVQLTHHLSLNGGITKSEIRFSKEAITASTWIALRILWQMRR